MKNLFCLLGCAFVQHNATFSQNINGENKLKTFYFVGETNSLGKQGIWSTYSKKDSVLIS
jgi:hypothetical protein